MPRRLLIVTALLLASTAAVASELGSGGWRDDASFAPQRAGGFSLGLEASVLGKQPVTTFEPSSAIERSPSAERVAAIHLSDVRELVAFRQQDPAPVDPAPVKSEGSFGRWLKRHWWVPALVGAAVVATAGESLWDDDDEDDED